MRRSLSNVGGPSDLGGDLSKARILARCFAVTPAKELPLTHGFHPYPGRMHPGIAERVIGAFAPRRRVVDPFVGSGTVAVEAVRAGLPFLGADISKVALEVAWLRTRVWPPEQCRRIEKEGAALAEAAARISKGRPLPDSERDWYSPHTFSEIASLRAAIDAVPDAWLRRVFVGVLSALLVRLSKQVSDSTTVVDAEFRPWPAGTAFRLFREKCSELTKRLLLLSSDLHKRKIRPVDPELRQADARRLELEPRSVDLVLTSPPYPGTYDYALHHARRYPLFEDSVEAVGSREIGSRSATHDEAAGLKRYRDDLAECLKRLVPALVPGGRIVLLIGDGVAAGRGVDAARLVREIASEAGARAVAAASQDRTDWSHGRKGRGRQEHLIQVEATSS